MRIVIDMNLSPLWCETLQRNGYAYVHWSQVGDPRASDCDVMKWPLENEHSVLAHDLDFGAILAATRASGPSVLQVRAQDLFPQHLESLILGALHRFEEELRSGALIALDETRLRARILPLK